MGIGCEGTDLVLVDLPLRVLIIVFVSVTSVSERGTRALSEKIVDDLLSSVQWTGR
ncbi:hypothetical protein AXX17_AT4G31740 [Arabidopsis thaliana]|uniref:Uncharacterized protein n=1 Tax=Arabidopsis thaliana TaxID=3702 RepID=A0A178V055_ARATH|nr:hypothetical protein AXX17_AT4G31740 [Arabidopsis thaliana]